MQVLQIILAAHPNRPAGDGVMLGKNEKRFFQRSTTDQPYSLGAGLQAWRGFSSSVRPAHKQLMVSVNICTTAFYTPGNLAEQMVAYMQASFSANPNGFAFGVRVKTTHLGHTKSIKGVSKFTARTFKFPTDDYGEVTVEQYFKLSKPPDPVPPVMQ